MLLRSHADTIRMRQTINLINMNHGMKKVSIFVNLEYSIMLTMLIVNSYLEKGLLSYSLESTHID